MFFFLKIRCISVHDTYHQQIMPWPATVMFFACIQVEDLATNSVRPHGRCCRCCKFGIYETMASMMANKFGKNQIRFCRKVNR